MGLIFVGTLAHFILASFSDNIGFSSNHEFYYRNLHPVRHMIISGFFYGSLVGTILCCYMLLRRSRKV